MRALVAGAFGMVLTWGAACGSSEGDEPAPFVTGMRPGELPPGVKALRYFPEAAIWHHDVTTAELDNESPAVISGLAALGGFGGGEIKVDFSIEVLPADETTPMREFVPSSGHFYSPDCDHEPVPIPPGGALEAEWGYECVRGGDCHLIVHHRPTARLFEMWKANITNLSFTGGCLAVWDLSRVYGPNGRGEQCASADAAGFPIAPLLFSADEVQAGSVAHAIRFVLPQKRIRKGVYVHPASHAAGTASGEGNTPPYGTRLRLRRDFPIDLLPNQGARVVARALQTYGMFLADGGTTALTAQSDRFTHAKWGFGPERLLGETDLAQIRITDFEMVKAGKRVPFSAQCVRN